MAVMKFSPHLPSWMTASKKKPKERPRIGYPKILATHPAGSRYTCDPPVTDTDDDTWVLVDQLPNVEEMKEMGWELSGKDPDGQDEYPENDIWNSYKMGEKNLILIASKEWYIRCVAATLLCKQMNLTDKKDRIKVHEFLQDKTFGYNGPIPNKGLL